MPTKMLRLSTSLRSSEASWFFSSRAACISRSLAASCSISATRRFIADISSCSIVNRGLADQIASTFLGLGCPVLLAAPRQPWGEGAPHRCPLLRREDLRWRHRGRYGRCRTWPRIDVLATRNRQTGNHRDGLDAGLQAVNFGGARVGATLALPRRWGTEGKTRAGEKRKWQMFLTRRVCELPLGTCITCYLLPPAREPRCVDGVRGQLGDLGGFRLKRSERSKTQHGRSRNAVGLAETGGFRVTVECAPRWTVRG